MRSVVVEGLAISENPDTRQRNKSEIGLFQIDGGLVLVFSLIALLRGEIRFDASFGLCESDPSIKRFSKSSQACSPGF